tara:strand:+ start:1154 stop:1525 length:372 start_codon:yes stop_codon:yes gene_type:complete
MNKIENLAYLFAIMMDSDGKVNIKELNSWYQIVEKRWPEVSKEQAGNAIKNSLYSLKSQNEAERINNLEKVLAYLKCNLKNSDLDNIAQDLSKMIQADGLISIGEINLAGMLKWKLGLDINFN